MSRHLNKIGKIAAIVGIILLVALAVGKMALTIRNTAQQVQDNTAKAYVIDSYISSSPFGESITEVTHGQQLFYNMAVKKDDGITCFINVSFRWVLRMKNGDIVYWTDQRGGESATTIEYVKNVSQAFMVPKDLLPGKYTLSRLSTYKCGDDSVYARVIRTLELTVK